MDSRSIARFCFLGAQPRDLQNEKKIDLFKMADLPTRPVKSPERPIKARLGPNREMNGPSRAEK